jgi:hypothetical protein
MSGARRLLRAVLLSGVWFVAIAASSVAAASANFEFEEASIAVKDANGGYTRQAGSHPDFTFSFSIPSREEIVDGSSTPFRRPVEMMRDVDLELPPGLLANAQNYPTCAIEQLVGTVANPQEQCAVETQIGMAKLSIPAEVGIFNLEHGPDVPALFGFNYLGYVATIAPQVEAGPYGDPGRYGITAGSAQIGQGLAVWSASLTFWGNPASPQHDFERQGTGLPFILGIYGPPFPSGAPEKPFFTTTTSCGAAQTFTARGDSWEHPGVFSSRSIEADEVGTPFVWEGCERLPFAPAVELSPTSQAASSTTGVSFHLTLPQNGGLNGLATSAAKSVSLKLPQGVTISPSVAAGQAGCSSAQVALASNEAPSCPASSRIGSVVVQTPLLGESLRGSMVLASQDDNPFHATYAVYMLIKGPGFWLKLPGELNVNRQTGQIQTVFDELPQLPFESVDVQLESGPGAPLATPSTCGTYDATTEITPWARPTEPVTQTIPMTFDQNCQGGGFAPGLKGGTVNPSAGRRSPFVLTITRQDGEQNLSQIDITLPKGQLASLKGVAECPEAQAGSGQCPSSSQIGVAKAAVGVGSEPLQVPQPGKAPTALFLGGPYKGAPLSLVALVPAQAGPFDLGNVVVRTALEVDPTTTQVSAKSDPLPQMIEGVPLSYREVRIELTRPEFTVNPTSCEPTQITSTLTSLGGAQAHPSVPYQVGSCASLGFSPKLQLAMSGSTKRAGNPALSATLKAPEGQANIASTTVILPKTVFIDQRHVNNPCTRVQFNANACPANSILGTATAWSPLLDQPLTGPVYFRSNGGERQLPDIVADLNGQIHVVLVGFIDSKKVGKETSLVRTRFASVPDAPVSRFVIKLKGGKRSLIQNSANLCKARPKAEVKMGGQNGKASDFKAPISVKCGKKSKKNAAHKPVPKH